MEEQEELRARNRMEEIAFDATLRQSFERGDERYTAASQARDWLILVAIGAAHFTWMLLVFLFEPGIR
jgi:DNA-binding PucR family transcriptional regulator